MPYGQVGGGGLRVDVSEVGRRRKVDQQQQVRTHWFVDGPVRKARGVTEVP